MYLFSKKELKQSNKGLEELKNLILQKESSFLEEVIRLGFNFLGKCGARGQVKLWHTHRVY